MNKSAKHTITLTLLIALLAPTSVWAAGRSTVEIVNRSSWDIYELYLSSVDTSDWGPDQLRDNVIISGGSYLLHNIPCDYYDVQLIDEDGDICIVGGIPLCADSDVWVIDDRDLLSCQALSQ